MKEGIDILLEIDYQGAEQIMKMFPEAVGIFILPPSIDTLRKRLKSRGQDSDEVILKRIIGAGQEIAQSHKFEYVIINEDFDTALDELCSVIKASRLRYRKQAARYREIFVELGLSS